MRRGSLHFDLRYHSADFITVGWLAGPPHHVLRAGPPTHLNLTSVAGPARARHHHGITMISIPHQTSRTLATPAARPLRHITCSQSAEPSPLKHHTTSNAAMRTSKYHETLPPLTKHFKMLPEIAKRGIGWKGLTGDDGCCVYDEDMILTCHAWQDGVE